MGEVGLGLLDSAARKKCRQGVILAFAGASAVASATGWSCQAKVLDAWAAAGVPLPEESGERGLAVVRYSWCTQTLVAAAGPSTTMLRVTLS